MKRARAVELVERMLGRLDADQTWPIGLVQQVWVFGSFARGACEPHDVDVAVRFERDEQMRQAVVEAILSGRANPYAPLRHALAGTSRGLHFQFEDHARERLRVEGTAMLSLWQRGDTLAQALTVLHSIPEDPVAGRAERHDMIDAFTGLDRYIPRPVRAELIAWRQRGLVDIARIPLSDVPQDTDLLADPHLRWAVDRRWNDDSPLRRAALAGLSHLLVLGADLDDVDLAGQRLPTLRRLAGHRSDARWWINWKWRGYSGIPHRVPRGKAWLEVVQPTRTRPLTALMIRPGPHAVTPRK
ncbi:nucleotidyltransferase domain-containing protein [Embleya sp. NPDC059237]|uniref:nucleotidyltransferase domain-containing protein n=1 Tax=Embleya sp. NPDC059237 TaxID=3346784 RepID=UPI0036B589DE